MIGSRCFLPGGFQPGERQENLPAGLNDGVDAESQDGAGLCVGEVKDFSEETGICG